jgi:DNA-binding FadR family transcriptional regulator
LDPETGGVRPGKAARIARQIEADVIRRGWPVGESLGSELSLQQRYGVSRSVLREAVRLVEHHQVAQMRRGPGGGLIVSAPDAGPATRAVVIYLEYLGTTIDELLDARVLLEPLAARLAAERVDEAGIARLRALGCVDLPKRIRDDFQVVLGESAGNPVLALFIDVLIRLTARYAVESQAPAAAVADALDQLKIDRGAIIEAVTAGDAARAQTLTAQHVEQVTSWLRRYHRPGRARGRGVRRVEAAAQGKPKSKLAEVLAAGIYEDIAADGWRIGALFGTETELLERYRVSRSVLREAVRLLEYHTVARMRRGPGGGLLVTEPAQQASIDTVALYLEYRKPARDDLRLVRDAIELSNVAAVVARRDDPEVAAFLDAAFLEAQRADASPDGGDPRAAGRAEFIFHTDLADLAGNRVLNLFLRILVELFRRHWGSTMEPMPGPDDAAEMHRAHARIAEAIADGDASIARHRSRRHLEALTSWWV